MDQVFKKQKQKKKKVMKKDLNTSKEYQWYVTVVGYSEERSDESK